MTWTWIATFVLVFLGAKIYLRMKGIKPEELQHIREQISAGSPLIDVRTPGEFSSGHIEGAINIPLSQLSSKMKDLKKRRAPLVVYCASGTRSAKACKELQKKGIEAINLGPMWNWRR